MTKKLLRNIYDLLHDSITGLAQVGVTLHAAGLAYFSLLSMVPLLIISIAIASIVFSQAAVEDQIVTMLTNAIGPDTAKFFKNLIGIIHNRDQDVTAIGLGLIFLIFSASLMFRQVRDSVNIMWGIAPDAQTVPQNLLISALGTLKALAAALSVGLFLIGLLFLNALTIIPEKLLSAWLGVEQLEIVFELLHYVASPILLAIVFILIFKTLPNGQVRWRDVWPGGIVTALLFWLGSYLIGIYLRYSTLTSVYGTASSIIAFILWLYYLAYIFLFGAKFTQVYAGRFGVAIEPEDNYGRITIVIT